jgi:hypothetical protein
MMNSLEPTKEHSIIIVDFALDVNTIVTESEQHFWVQLENKWRKRERLEQDKRKERVT